MYGYPYLLVLELPDESTTVDSQPVQVKPQDVQVPGMVHIRKDSWGFHFV
jgi:hypothetical protein